MQSLGKIKRLVKTKYKKNGHYDRFVHIKGVARMAKFLAKRYNVDPKKALIAAYMHDFYKYESQDELKEIINKEDATECENYPVLYHSYASSMAYLKLVGNDIDIYNAIRNHVFGRLSMSKLEEIILISDYTEKNRTYPNCIHCRKILLDGSLNKAIYQSTKYTIEFLEKKEIKPHPLQLEVLKYYEGRCEK